jgi:D-serine deaminase-like pyridoxal phosphate-dependent protein
VSLAEFDTPFVAIDLDRVDRNISVVQDYCDRHALACRPHVKTHKLPQLAREQIAAGAVGITCQKLGEAEVMASAGLTDILIAFPLLGSERLRRLAEVASATRLTLVGDSIAVVDGLSSTLTRAGAEAISSSSATLAFAAQELKRRRRLPTSPRPPTVVPASASQAY